MLVTSVICWIVVKTKIPGRWLLDNIASLPMVFPGLVLGLSIMIFYLNVDIGIYGTIWIMLIAYITRFMPYGLRYSTTSMLQIHKELEESAAMSGASWTTTFRQSHPAAAEAGTAGRLDLRDDRLDPRALDVDPALQPRHAGDLHRDLGAVGEWPVRRAVGARRAVHHRALRAGDGRAVARQEVRRQGVKRSSDVAVKIEGLFTEYPNERGEIVKAAQDVSFTVAEGQLFTLLGPSGCGKTTTLRSIAGLERPRAGEISVNGRVVYSSAQGRLRRARTGAASAWCFSRTPSGRT